jgi:signal transduction histidine kinase
VFGRFYREPEVHGEAGIGIGLYLTRKIIELQKGYVEVGSRVGEGADFRIYLPND